jgi:hypothetical protein
MKKAEERNKSVLNFASVGMRIARAHLAQGGSVMHIPKSCQEGLGVKRDISNGEQDPSKVPKRVSSKSKVKNCGNVPGRLRTKESTDQFVI